jgi:hypothetical protein
VLMARPLDIGAWPAEMRQYALWLGTMLAKVCIRD